MTRTASLALVSLLVGGLTLGALTPAIAAPVGTTTVDGIVFEADDEDVDAGATVTDYTGPGGSVIIPDMVTIGPDEYAVITIGESAFRSKALTSVTIPNSVTTIGTAAFQSNALTTLTIGTGVTTIGIQAFRSNALTSVTIPTNVTTIGNTAFRDNLLASVTIPNNVTTIEDAAFQGNLLASVTLGTGVSTISDSAFRANALASLEIPSSVTTIGNFAFSDNLLTSVEIPSSVTTINFGAFRNNLLASFTIPSSVTTIFSSAFRNNLLTSVTIPSSVTTIGGSAFADNNLSSVRLLGPAPLVFLNAFGTTGTEGPLLTYSWRYGASQTPGGYTPGTWNDYRSQSVATVAFDTNGGSESPAEQEIALEDTITQPAAPTRAGFTLTGWFTAPTGSSAWDFTTALSDEILATVTSTDSADLTLYAQWAAVDTTSPETPAVPEAPVTDNPETTGPPEATSPEVEELANTGAVEPRSVATLAGALLALGLTLVMIRRRTARA